VLEHHVKVLEGLVTYLLLRLDEDLTYPTDAPFQCSLKELTALRDQYRFNLSFQQDVVRSYPNRSHATWGQPEQAVVPNSQRVVVALKEKPWSCEVCNPGTCPRCDGKLVEMAKCLWCEACAVEFPKVKRPCICEANKGDHHE
jgi:hypothetical protein